MDNLKNVEDMHIIIPSSSRYVPYLGVLIISAIINKNADDSLYFHILSEDITEIDKKQLLNLNKFGDFKIEFLKMNPDTIKDVPVCKAFFINNLANYKLKIASIFKDLKKVLIMEVDMIIQSSLRELFDFDMKNSAFAAVKDPWCEELQPILDIPKKYRYCNTGMFLADLEAWRNRNLEQTFFENIKIYSDKLIFPDQDIFNITFFTETIYLPQKWNVYSNVPYTHKDEQEEAFKDADSGVGIIHYASEKKPWFFVEQCNYSELWWQYARKTPFYEVILERLCTKHSSSVQNYLEMAISEVKQYKLNVLKYWKYKFFKNFVWGRMKERYSVKKGIYKNRIKHAEQFMK